MTDEVLDIDQWLADRSIPREYADSVARTVADKYPVLTAAVKAHRNVRAELELIFLVYQVSKGSLRSSL